MCINCSFLKHIFAVLLPDLSRLSCHSIQRMPLKKWTQDVKHINQSKSPTTGADFRNGMVKRVKLRQHAKFRGDTSNRRRGGDFSIFPRWRPSAILDLLCVCVRTTYEGYLVVFIAVQNLVSIDAVVLIICLFFDFASLDWKRLFTLPKLFLGRFYP